MSDIDVNSLELDQAESLSQDLLERVQDIDLQLGDRNRTDKNGHRLSSREYSAWRDRVRREKVEITRLRTRLKRRIQQLSPEADLLRLSGHQVKVLNELLSEFEPDELEDEERSLVNLISRLATTYRGK